MTEQKNYKNQTNSKDLTSVKSDKAEKAEKNASANYAANSLKVNGGVSPQQTQAQAAAELERLKGKLEGFKKAVVKKYNYTIAILLLPQQSFMMFEEDEALAKEVIDSKPLHVMMIIPEEHFKDIPKIKPEIVKLVKETGENLWVHIKTPVDLWNYGLDSKFEFVDAVSSGFPLYDKGFLGALRVANIHKSLVLRKFEKYVASYVIGGSLVRGTAIETSDVDTFVIIDDTDVKRMSRIELLEKLRGMIYDYVREATALAGVKNVLSVQVWLLTDFWQRVKDAEPVAFTFIRDGIPFYDRGTFIPWKLLLKMGKIKPSPEAVDMYIKSGDQTKEMVNRRLMDAMVDCYYGILTPAQAMMMLAGQSPPTHKEAPRMFKEYFYDKEKLVDMKYIKILEKGVRLFKEYEHGTLKEISGKEVDTLLVECKEFNEMVKKLRGKLEARIGEQVLEKVHDETMSLLKNIFGDKSKDSLVKLFETELVKKGKLSPRMTSAMKRIAKIDKMDKKKISALESQEIVRDSNEVITALIEYSQRKDLVKVEKSIMQVAYAGRKADLVLTDGIVFVVEVDKIRKVSEGKLIDSNKKELEEHLSKSKNEMKFNIPSDTFAVLKKELGDFEIIL